VADLAAVDLVVSAAVAVADSVAAARPEVGS
jgi:hypothetical protein